jgi:hypothetical protein
MMSNTKQNKSIAAKCRRQGWQQPEVLFLFPVFKKTRSSFRSIRMMSLLPLSLSLRFFVYGIVKLSSIVILLRSPASNYRHLERKTLKKQSAGRAQLHIKSDKFDFNLQHNLQTFEIFSFSSHADVQKFTLF